MKKEIIVIDIDDVIASKPAFGGTYASCKPILGAREAINKLREKYLVYLHTGRHINWAEVTIEWLKTYNFEYDHIQFGKPPALVYIDDKGMRFKSWTQVMQQLEDTIKSNI